MHGSQQESSSSSSSPLFLPLHLVHVLEICCMLCFACELTNLVHAGFCMSYGVYMFLVDGGITPAADPAGFAMAFALAGIFNFGTWCKSS